MRRAWNIFRSAEAGADRVLFLGSSTLPEALLVLLLFTILGSICEIIMFNFELEVLPMVKKMLNQLFTDIVNVITAFGISLLAGVALLT